MKHVLRQVEDGKFVSPPTWLKDRNGAMPVVTTDPQKAARFTYRQLAIRERDSFKQTRFVIEEVDDFIQPNQGDQDVSDLIPPHKAQTDVEDFHRALDIPIGDSPAIRRPELRANLILEETRETCEAILGRKITIEIGDEGSAEQSLVEAVDGMVDVCVVTYGTAVEFGVNLARYWDEVHKTNMAKKGGPIRDDGKRLKPEGWEPPEIARILDEEIAESEVKS